MAEDELENANLTGDEYTYPEVGFGIQHKDNGLGDCYLRIVTRVNVTMQGNYRLEVRFTLSDILKMFWICFKDKALQVAFSEAEKGRRMI
ncbi:MAG: hypothetical protein ACT4O2_15210 [Beijerinckiaceae bacterium]